MNNVKTIQSYLSLALRREIYWVNSKVDLMDPTLHISRNGGHLSFFIFPLFWCVFKVYDASRGILPKKLEMID